MVLDRLSERFPTLLMARRNLTRTRVRTALAALGIVIGVIAIASLGMLGLSLRAEINENLGDIGNQVVVTPGEDNFRGLTNRDIQRIRKVAGDSTVVPAKSSRVPVVYNPNGEPEVRSVTGMDNPSKIYTAKEGRIPDPLRSGVLVGPKIADEHDLSPGSTIGIGGTSFRVRAVLESSGFGIKSADEKIIVPASEFRRPTFDQVTITTDSGPEANATAVALREEFNDRRELVQVQDLSQAIDQIESSFRLLNGFLIGIGAISLLVAGVAILNVMLMSTVERREEIGVLRAVGFQQRDILKVILAEAALLGVVGGLVGVVLSVGTGMIINHFVVNDAMATFRLENVPFVMLAFGFGVLTAVVSGLYPAWKAARERPVEALRS